MIIEFEDFLRLVRAMRQKQEQWHRLKTRTPQVLKEARQLERIVDGIVRTTFARPCHDAAPPLVEVPHHVVAENMP